MHEDELALFLKEMKGVKPQKGQNKVTLAKDAQTSDSKYAQARASDTIDRSKNNLPMEPTVYVEPQEVLSFKRVGIAHGVFKKLKNGQYPIEARLDLHRKTVKQAREEVFSFVKSCMGYDIRSGIILHGKAEHAQVPALIKSCVNCWLPQIDDVLAFHSAQIKHGGTGAVYILMKKSEKLKQENREVLTKGRPDPDKMPDLDDL